LNSADATYDLGMSGVYARNVAFEPASRRRAVATADDDDSLGGVTELDHAGPPITRSNDNEYEYVWDASAVAARTPRPGQLHRGKTTETGGSGGRASTSFGGRPSDQCRCMSESTRTMPRQVSAAPTNESRYRNEKPSHSGGRHRVDKTVTLGRFGHLESRSAARSAGGGGPTGKGQRQGRVDDLTRRVCPHCGHQSSTTPGDGAACAASTPPARLDSSVTLPRRQNAESASHRRA